MLRVGLIGCGNIGRVIAAHVAESDSFSMGGVLDVNGERASSLLSDFGFRIRPSETIDDLIEKCDVVVEAASQEVVRKFAVLVLNAGRELIVMSAGALVDQSFLAEVRRAAEDNKVNVYVPSGALCGVDGIKAAGVGVIDSVLLVSTKPTSGVVGV